jgi:small-conductance mechanosensitive channel
MDEIVEVLLHPAQWSQVESLSSHQRLILAALVLGLTAIVAFVAGVVSARWARRRAATASAAGVDGRLDDRARRLGRSFVWLSLSVGTFYAVNAAPLADRLQSFLGSIAFVVGAIALARSVVHLVTLLLILWMARVPGEERRHIERDYIPLVQKLLVLAVGMILVVVVAKHFGKDASSLVAALGVGSLAIGLAAQAALGNMIAGFVLLVDRPFRPGDRIKLATGEIGEVLEVGGRSTRIRMVDRNLLIVPNTELANSRVVNLSAPTGAGEVKLLLAQDADVDKAVAIASEAVRGDEKVLADPAPTARIGAIGDIGIELVVGFHVASPAEVLPTDDRVRRRLIAALRAGGISLARRVV